MAKKKKQIEEDLPQITLIELEKGVGNIARDAYIDYGHYVNTSRHMAEVRDGCKISYRRLIYTAYTYGKNAGDIPTATLIPSTAKYHPHSTDGLIGTNAVLVHSGVFSGEGNFGSEGVDGVSMPPSSPRYTKNRLSDLYWELIGDLMKEVPYVESPVGAPEPEFLPLPIPLVLYLKTAAQGLGVGLRADYPNFSPWSMYQALKADNPMLLEPGVDLLMDKKNSELIKLWNTGKGRVIYSYKIERATSEDGRSQGIMFSGSTDLFTIPLFKNKIFKKWIEDGKIYYENMTDINGPKLFVGKVPGSKGITPEDIEDLCRKCCFSSSTYNLNVTDGKSAFRIPLKDWLKFCLENYYQLVTQVNAKRIEKTKFDIAVQEALPSIASAILANPKAADKEIIAATGVSAEVLEAVISKPISWLRKNTDTTARIKSLKEKLKELKKFDPIHFTEEIIKQL